MQQFSFQFICEYMHVQTCIRIQGYCLFQVFFISTTNQIDIFSSYLMLYNIGLYFGYIQEFIQFCPCWTVRWQACTKGGPVISKPSGWQISWCQQTGSRSRLFNCSDSISRQCRQSLPVPLTVLSLSHLHSWTVLLTEDNPWAGYFMGLATRNLVSLLNCFQVRFSLWKQMGLFMFVYTSRPLVEGQGILIKIRIEMNL